MQCFNKITGKPVTIGDELTGPYDEHVIVTGFQPPHRLGVSGKIYVQSSGQQHPHGYYAQVFNCEYRDAEGRCWTDEGFQLDHLKVEGLEESK